MKAVCTVLRPSLDRYAWLERYSKALVEFYTCTYGKKEKGPLFEQQKKTSALDLSVSLYSAMRYAFTTRSGEKMLD